MSTDLSLKFEPVSTLEELDSLDSNMIVQGYMLGCKGYPEPEFDKAVWHGWRNGMIDTKRMESDQAYYTLARLVVERSRQQK